MSSMGARATIRLRVVHTARLETLARQAGSFTAIGAASSLANAGLYLLLREWFNAVTALVIAVAVTTLASTEANRRLTFDSAPGSRTSLTVHNLSVILFYCTYNSLALWVVHMLVTDPPARVESVAILVASIAGGVARFALLRGWVFRDRTDDDAPPPGDPHEAITPEPAGRGSPHRHRLYRVHR
ncbi:MAG: GtrA family protein [Pseudonocardiaceae bacterium]